MNDRTVKADETEVVWSNRVKAGTKRIKKHWARLQPQTKKLLTQDGFDDRGCRLVPPESWDDTSDLVYALGLFDEAVKAVIPAKNGDPIPSCYDGHDLLNEATNLILKRQYCDPEFTALALHACMKQQVSSAVVSFYYNGGDRVKTKSVPGKAIAGIVLRVLFAFSIGNGLVVVLNHDVFSACLSAFIAMLSYGAMKHLDTPDVESKWTVAYSHWSSLIFRDFHVGTAHGVEQQLQQFLRHGVHVHSVLFDLCAALQQGIDLSRRIHITTMREST